MSPAPGDQVRLTEHAEGMPAGSEGVLIGWYVGDNPTALVRFWDGGPIRVPLGVIMKAEPGTASPG